MEFLSEDGNGDYFEIQGGVTPTQLQTRPLLAHGSLEWTECLAPLAINSKTAHDPDYATACTAAGNAVEQRVSNSALQEMNAFLTAQAASPIETLLHRGSGWGCLYEKRTGQKLSPGLAFEARVSDEERPWDELLSTGTFSRETLSKQPASFNVSTGWSDALRESADSHGATWLHHVHLGVAELERGLFDTARRHFKSSLALKENALAHRCLALQYQRDGDLDAATAAYDRAWSLCEKNQDLAVEISEFFMRHKRYGAFDTFVKALPASIAGHERITLMKAKIALERGEYATVRQLLQREYCTIREGELSLSELWFASYIKEAENRVGHALTSIEKRKLMRDFPPPRQIDFGM
jgi:Tfp pilus assembly protein PilF